MAFTLKAHPSVTWLQSRRDRFFVIDRHGATSLEVSGHSAPGLALREQLTALYRERTRDKILFLKADTALPFGVVEHALVDARHAGVRVIAAITERKVEPGM